MNMIKFPLLIDGGLSNVLENYGCDLNDDLWSAKLLSSNPEAIIDAHIAYLESGAQCITTSSYQASVVGFMDKGHDKESAELLVLKSIELASMAVERFMNSNATNKKPLIAASIGPYGAFLADGSEYRGDYDVSNEVLMDFHLEKIELLDHSAADIFACETIPSFQEAKVLSEILKKIDKPAWVSFSCKDDLHINDGTLISQCASLFADHPSVFAIGVNCTSPKYISGLIKELKTNSGGKRIVVYPNSGEAYNAESKTWMGLSNPNQFGKMAQEWIALGCDIIGGCCRIGPEHIRELRAAME